MRTILLSTIPGAILAAVIDNFIPTLSTHAFDYVAIAGMLIFSLFFHILSALFGHKKEDQTKYHNDRSFSPI